MDRSNLHVCIVDDSSTNNLLCKILFEENGYKVTIIEEGAKAFPTIKSEKPDIVLLDLMMPDVDGIMVIRDLKADSATKNIPVMIVSAAESGPFMSEIMSYKPIDYVRKPIGLNDLLERVDKYFMDVGMLF